MSHILNSNNKVPNSRLETVGIPAGGTGAVTAAAAFGALTPVTTSSSSTPSLNPTDVTLGLTHAAPIVTLGAIATYPTGYQALLLNHSGNVQVVGLDPNGSEVVNGGGAGAIMYFTVSPYAALFVKVYSATVWSVHL